MVTRECGNEGSLMCIQATSIDAIDCAPYIWFFESRDDRVEAWEGHKWLAIKLW